MTVSRLLLASLLPVALLACGGGDGGDDPTPDASTGPDATATPTAVETETLTIGAGQFEEAEFAAGPGDQVHVIMTAPTADLAWNIHGHADGSTQIIVEEDGVMTVDYWFEPTSQADWYLMPGNRGSTPLTVEVTIELYGDATFTGWL